MNRMLTSILALGAGMAAYNYATNNKIVSGRQMRKLRRRIDRLF
ncbi:YrzQ family protein [Bacillus sp. REN3]|nr:YrzQ family protein [Bacillus sp. REN3]